VRDRIVGQDIRIVATRYPGYCDSPSGSWRYRLVLTRSSSEVQKRQGQPLAEIS
jgi:hypothetical protein